MEDLYLVVVMSGVVSSIAWWGLDYYDSSLLKVNNFPDRPIELHRYLHLVGPFIDFTDLFLYKHVFRQCY